MGHKTRTLEDEWSLRGVTRWSTGQLLLCLRGYAEMEEREGCRHLGLWRNVLELESCCFLIATPPQVNTIDEQLPLRRGISNLEGIEGNNIQCFSPQWQETCYSRSSLVC